VVPKSSRDAKAIRQPSFRCLSIISTVFLATRIYQISHVSFVPSKLEVFVLGSNNRKVPGTNVKGVTAATAGKV
jgi:hypothetical protein